jgi:hypothetical protein
VALKSISEAAVREWLRVNGEDHGKIKFFELPYSEMRPVSLRGPLPRRSSESRF